MKFVRNGEEVEIKDFLGYIVFARGQVVKDLEKENHPRDILYPARQYVLGQDLKTYIQKYKWDPEDFEIRNILDNGEPDPLTIFCRL